MTDRLNRIFAELDSCEIFADVGCDHGYIAKAMLLSGKAKRAIISDVSAKCLSKAEELLSTEILEGRVESVVSDGFDKIKTCDLALIAGMGGEEIVSIISKAKNLPNKLVLQPMKNLDKVRVCAVNHGYKVVKDYVFYSSGIYYDLLVLEKGKDCLTDDEIEFGRTNLIERPDAFINLLKEKIEKLGEYAEKDGLSERTRADMIERKQRLEKYVKI